MRFRLTRLSLVILFISISGYSFSQWQAKEINWTADGSGYYSINDGNIMKTELPSRNVTTVVKKEQLIPAGKSSPLSFSIYSFSRDGKKLIIFNNTEKVWRYNTRGDYWVLDLASGKLVQLGKGRPSQSLMFAKLSPDGTKAAYVSEHNIYLEDFATGKITPLTTNGSRKFINGTFDWVYEEELDCRDGFRWSPDSKSIAFWQVDATKIRDYYMLNTTDSVYSQVIPVEYPKVGQPPSPVRVGVITVATGATKMMNVPGDPQEHYIPLMEWAANSDELLVQQLDRKQQESKLFYCNIHDGSAKNFYTDKNNSWVEIRSHWNDGDPEGWDWLNNGKDFLLVSEKDGWGHIYRISRDGKKETLITKGNFDIGTVKNIDEAGNYVYFTASPDNSTELYLYRAKLDGSGSPELVSPASLKGTHDYTISPNGKYAEHNFSNYQTFPVSEWVTLPDHKPLSDDQSIARIIKTDPRRANIEYFTITTEDNITLDGWMTKPKNFDSTKKYPVVFYVYGEPAATTTANRYGGQRDFLFNGDMSGEGYFYVSLDNRGTPALKGAAWRKSIYKQIGRLNIRDQAMGAKKLLERSYFDKDRVAVWGWSGGGSSTLNLMFQYPEIYKTGISVSAVDNLLFYDNIYEERYMGLPQEDKDA
jgi:dipeptidyl-peptidase 4